MPSHTSPPPGAFRWASRPVLASAVLIGTGLASVQPALAAELVTAELVGDQNVVEVEQGKTAAFTVNLSAIDRASCNSTHTAAVKNTFAISSAGVVGSGTTFTPTVGFIANGSQQNNNCSLTGGGTVNATISASSTTAIGTYTVALSTAAGTTQVSSSNHTGTKLADATATTLTFRVVAPPNTAPRPGNAPANATGVEGSTLGTSGSFTDADGNLSSIALTSGAGTVTADRTPDGKLSGSWSWNLPTTDNVSGTVTVTATDAGGLTATQSFTYAASNVAPRVSVAASDALGNEGDTLRTGGAFADVSGDPLVITMASGAGTVVDNRNGTWSWSLGAGNETSGTVTVQASDGDGGVTVDSFDYRALNVAPGVRTAAVDPSGDEGSTISTSGAFFDVPADALTIRRAGDGVLVDNGDGTWSWSLDAQDDGRGTVTVTATDGVASGADDFTYTVRNVAPAVAVAASDVNGDEGTTLRGAGRFGDVAADALTISKFSGPGTVTGNADGTWTWTYDGTDQLVEDVVVQADDGDGGVTTDTFRVTVRNVAPVIATPAAPATGSEGNVLTTSGRFADVPADTISIIQTPGAGTLVDNADGTWSWSLATTDQTNGTVQVVATDEDGGRTTDTFTYSAVNVAPQVVRAAADATVDEGMTLRASGAFGDVAGDGVTVAQVSGPGTVTDLGNGSWSYELATTDQLATQTVEVQATDKDGAVSVIDDFTVTAVNVAPAVGTAPGGQTGLEGDTLRTSGSFTDVPADPITISRESGAGTVTDNGDGTWSWSLATADDASGTVVVKADDGDGGITRSTFTYAAGNVAPAVSTLTVTGASGTACVTGNTVGLTFSVTDPGAADTMTGTIIWGDGTTESFTSRSVDTTHSYAPGTYTITVQVTDDDGAVSNVRTTAVSRSFAVAGIQAPYNADGTSVFKHGSVAPVKVRITDCKGNPVAGLAPTIKVGLASSAAPTTSINETVDSVSAADTTGVLRFDSASGNYIYNLATKSLSDSDAKYTVTVANGTSKVSQNFGLRTK